jgi:hypothetical protein
MSAESEKLLNNSTILRKYLDFLTEAYFPPPLPLTKVSFSGSTIKQTTQ